MKTIETTALVIGGGSTGVGVARDLAMRGIAAVLVEKRDLSHGATGRNNGMLHSGCRYGTKDSQAARECYQELLVLRRIMPHCLEDTGGFVVLTPGADPDFVPTFVDGCRGAGIPVEEVPVSRMLREEPALNPKISFCLATPDMSIDPFLATLLNAESARQYGASIRTYTELIRLVGEAGRVTGAVCRDLVRGEEITIRAEIVVNAAGAWAGQVAGTVGLDIPLLPSKGCLVALATRPINRVINHLRPPQNADGLIPSHSIVILGSTDGDICEPDDFSINPDHVRIILAEAAKVLPGVAQMRKLRVWAGVRPLYLPPQDGPEVNTRTLSRSHALLDHRVLDGVDGIVSIIGGKLTTYRLMAEETTDLVCRKLGYQKPCRTHLEPLPPRGHLAAPAFYWPGAALRRVEAAAEYGQLICECELVTRAEVESAFAEAGAVTLDDIRHSHRLGMGPCQGGSCAYRAAGLKHAIHRPPVAATNAALVDFLEARWRGLFPILAGPQLRQARLNELIYLDLLNVDHLPG